MSNDHLLSADLGAGPAEVVPLLLLPVSAPVTSLVGGAGRLAAITGPSHGDYTSDCCKIYALCLRCQQMNTNIIHEITKDKDINWLLPS